MAYGKKYVKKTTKVYKAVAKKTTKSPALSLQVAKLQRQVSSLNKVAINRVQYACDTSVNCYNATGTNDYQAVPMLKFNNWSRIFGTDADDETNKQAVIRSMKVNWHFTTNEPDNRDFSVFLVSLKDQASELLQDSTTADPGGLAPLVAGTHYHSSRSQTLLNLNFFNIHYHKRFTAGVYPMSKAAGPNSSGAVQNIPNTGIDTQRLGSMFLKCGARGIQVKNPAGDWKAGVYPKDPSKNYYMLFFWSGDSIVDLEYGGFNVRQLTQVDVSA